MLPLVRVNASSYARIAADHFGDGRYPIAMVTRGYVKGHGWGFLQPWAQIAVFPEKGTEEGAYHPHRQHEAFAIVRVYPVWMTARHRNHEEEVGGRYWWGMVTRASWPRPRVCLLDPDKVRDVWR